MQNALSQVQSKQLSKFLTEAERAGGKKGEGEGRRGREIKRGKGRVGKDGVGKEGG